MPTISTFIPARGGGTAVYPHLHEPDTFRGQTYYKCDMVVSPKKAKPLIDLIEEMIEEEFPPTKRFKDRVEKAHRPYEKTEGGYRFRVKSRYQPALYDIHGLSLDPEVRVGGGSTVKTKVKIKTYGDGKLGKDGEPDNYGVTIRLDGVQVLKLAQHFGDASDELEEDDEEDRAVLSTDEEPEETDASEDEGDEDDIEEEADF